MRSSPDPRRALSHGPAASEDHRVRWRQQAPRLLRVAIALGCAPDQAADLVQETLLNAFRKRDQFDPGKGTFDAWTHAILVHRLSNWRRARGRRLRALFNLSREIPAANGTPQAAVDARLELNRILSCLSPRQRRIWVLVEISGMSAREAAGILGLGEATLRSHLRHAREALARIVTKAGAS